MNSSFIIPLISEDNNDGNEIPHDQVSHRTEVMKVLEDYVQLLGTEERFKMKPLIGLINKFCGVRNNYVDKQLEKLFD